MSLKRYNIVIWYCISLFSRGSPEWHMFLRCKNLFFWNNFLYGELNTYGNINIFLFKKRSISISPPANSTSSKNRHFLIQKSKLNCGIIKVVPLDHFRVSHKIVRKFCSCYNWNHIKDMCCSFNWKINKKYWTLFTWIVKSSIVFITTVKLNSFDSLVELIHNSSLNKNWTRPITSLYQEWDK
jgi:hypothetical protein